MNEEALRKKPQREVGLEAQPVPRKAFLVEQGGAGREAGLRKTFACGEHAGRLDEARCGKARERKRAERERPTHIGRSVPTRAPGQPPWPRVGVPSRGRDPPLHPHEVRTAGAPVAPGALMGATVASNGTRR